MAISITIGGVNYTHNTILPIKWNGLLDERLDESKISLRHVSKNIFPIGAIVTIDGERDFIISADEATESPNGSGLFNHELSLIEPTKILEGILVETLTFTNNLGRTYSNNPINPPVRHYTPDGSYNWEYVNTLNVPTKGDSAYPSIGAYPSPVSNLNSLIINPINKQMTAVQGGKFTDYHTGENFEVNCPKLTVVSPSGKQYVKNNNTEGFTFDNPELGSWTVYYDVAYEPNSATLTVFRVIYDFVVVKDESALLKWDIASVLDRVFDLCEPHLTSVAPRFKLDPAQRAELAAILSPEFAFTKKTLKEILDAVGGFVHGIPRLIKGESGKFDTVHFDMLGGTEQATLADPKYDRFCVTNILTHDIESYATELDSSVENIVNVLGGGEGTIVEPYEGGYKTVRTESTYTQITGSDMEIATSFPIYTINKVEVMLESGKSADITAYIFEQADYSRLSSYDGVYPTSKAFALCYTFGQKGIRGLNFKSPTVYGGATANYAITNIIRAALNTDFDESWWKDAEYARLRFRVTYTPIFSSRVLQHKPHLDLDALPRALNYSQGANLIESRYYGENLKGLIARMGNVEKVRTYKIANNPTGRALIPKAGQMWGEDYYVSAVPCAEYAEHIDCTVGITKDFNRLSPYIGINSQWRAYEISERAVSNRDIVYRDFAVFGATESDVEEHQTSLANIELVLKALVMTFTQTYDAEIVGITAAEVRGYSGSELQSTVTLPVVSTAFGNSLVFNFYMEDNYSAGNLSEYVKNGDIKGYWQTGVQYPDYYGRLDTVSFDLMEGKVDTNINVAFELPKGGHTGYTYFGTSYARDGSINRLVVKKDGSETLRFGYELAFVTMHEWKSIIIGPALTHNCPFVNPIPKDEEGAAERAKHAAALYVLSNRISKFASVIDTASATLVWKYNELTPGGFDPIEIIGLDEQGADQYKAFVRLASTSAPVAGKAWVIADQITGEILLARNINLAKGDAIQFPELRLGHFVHKLP